MKERPIIFSDEMVRAILDGRKTQTRRPVKPQPRSVANGKQVAYNGSCEFLASQLDCPYGQPGDRLLVRECFAEVPTVCGGTELVYRADISDGSAPVKWTPSIHMPRWASRITLDVVAVRVERVQGISEADARAEGCAGRDDCFAGCQCNDAAHVRFRFAKLWDSIYGTTDYAWINNPWVWVVEFKSHQHGEQLT